MSDADWHKLSPDAQEMIRHVGEGTQYFLPWDPSASQESLITLYEDYNALYNILDSNHPLRKTLEKIVQDPELSTAYSNITEADTVY
jgi:hypothetical protein